MVEVSATEQVDDSLLRASREYSAGMLGMLGAHDGGVELTVDVEVKAEMLVRALAASSLGDMMLPVGTSFLPIEIVRNYDSSATGLIRPLVVSATPSGVYKEVWDDPDGSVLCYGGFGFRYRSTRDVSGLSGEQCVGVYIDRSSGVPWVLRSISCNEVPVRSLSGKRIAVPKDMAYLTWLLAMF